ncbi:GOLPH3/VPS74 family protein [Desertihabitans brevis]|uniref:GOLPH3/VPS74 family protein n=1 Tax=Desertihabitans brevis TaxID=2268447 RepID=UPI001F44AF6D|nr:GPP34 family phosphoprotein [Desertihabitans brevis]
MTQPDDHPDRPGGPRPDAAPTLAEDLLLLLFKPRSGTIAAEGTLYYALAGALLADLALDGRVRTSTRWSGAVEVAAVPGTEPDDELLRTAWRYVADRTRGVQTVLAAIGPTLRQPVLDRLVARGDVRQERRRALGLIPTTALLDGGTGRRDGLLADVRAVLVDGVEPAPRTAALTALVWAGGTLPELHPVIPWGAPVITRARELERGSWGAAAVGEAVTRTTIAVVTAVAATAVAQAASSGS